MKSITNIKKLKNYEGLVFSPKVISILVDGEAYPVAEKMKEGGPWLTMTGHNFSDFTEPLAENTIHGKNDEVEEVKESLEKAAMAQLSSLLPVGIENDRREIAEELIKIQNSPVGLLVKNGKMEEIRSKLSEKVDSWLNNAFVMLYVDKDIIEKLRGVRAVFDDSERRIESFSAMVSALSTFKVQIQEKFKGQMTEENFKNFEENLSTLRSYTTLVDLREHSSYKIHGKKIYEMHERICSLEEILDLLKKEG